MNNLSRIMTAAGLVLAAGCVSTPPLDLPQTEFAAMDSQGEQRADLLAGSYWFRPDRIVVKANAPVVLVVRKESTVVSHRFTIHAPEAGVSVDVPLSAEPKTVTFTPTKPGTYEYYCSENGLFGSHREKGMVGVLEVTE